MHCFAFHGRLLHIENCHAARCLHRQSWCRCDYSNHFFRSIHPKSSHLHELASISANIFSIFALFTFASSRFCAVRCNLSARKHMLTSCFKVLQLPIALCRKPLAWHSSRAVITSSHPWACQFMLKAVVVDIYLCYLWCGDEDASCDQVKRISVILRC